MPVPRVQWDAEQTVRLPLEAVLVRLVVPHCGAAPAFEHVCHFLEHVPLRLEGLARRDLLYVGAVHVARAVQLDLYRLPARARPGLERYGEDVVDFVAAEEVQAFARDPVVVVQLIPLAVAVRHYSTAITSAWNRPAPRVSDVIAWRAGRRCSSGYILSHSL